MHHFIEPLSDHEPIQMAEYLIEVVCQWFRGHRSIGHGHALVWTIGNKLVYAHILDQSLECYCNSLLSLAHTLNPRDPQHEQSGLINSLRADTVVFYSIWINWFTLHKGTNRICSLHHRGRWCETQAGRTRDSNSALGGSQDARLLPPLIPAPTVLRWFAWHQSAKHKSVGEWTTIQGQLMVKVTTS